MKRISSLATILLAATVITGCASFQRSYNSGYRGYGEDSLAVGRDRRDAERDASAGELGLRTRTLSDDEAQSVEERVMVRKAEKSLEGRRERDQYFKNKPYMKSDDDRLEFLSLNSLEARARWLNGHGIEGSATPNSPEIQALIDINDITMGMTKQAVRDSWGEPELVEVAGNPVYGNERWHYSEQLPSTEGYQTEQRLVYFESGRVVGWEKQ